MMAYNTLIVLAGAMLLGACAGLVGSFAVLRRRALTGDALAHAALPGLCIAFLLLGHKSLPAMLCGALVSGVLGVMVISGLRFSTRIKEDAAIGIVLSVFFGAGIVLTRVIQNQTATGSKAGLDSYILGKTAGMIAQDVSLIGGVSLFCLLLILLLYKEFKVVSFDPDFANVQGLPAFWLDLSLMALIALTVVIGLPAVGVVMMAALLIIPAAAARFWTERLETMLILSMLFGMATGAIGTLISARHALLPAGPTIVLAGTGIFVGSVLFAPRRGAIARVLQDRRFRRRVAQQNLLRVLYELTEERAAPHGFPLSEIKSRKSWSPSELQTLLRRACEQQYVTRNAGNTYALSLSGVERAAEVVRGQRLWETFLAHYAESAGHLTTLDSESLDDLLPRELIAELEAKLKAEGRYPSAVFPQQEREPPDD